MKIIRRIEWFDKKTEELVNFEEFSNIDGRELRRILQLEDDSEDPDLIYWGYDLSIDVLPKLQSKVRHVFLPAQYDYQISAYVQN